MKSFIECHVWTSMWENLKVSSERVLRISLRSFRDEIHAVHQSSKLVASLPSNLENGRSDSLSSGQSISNTLGRHGLKLFY